MSAVTAVVAVSLRPSPSTSPPSGPFPNSRWGTPSPAFETFKHNLIVTGIVVVCLLVAWLLLGAYLNRRKPLAFWYLYGYWFLWLRMRRTWSRVALNADLTATDRPTNGQFGSLMVKGQPIRPSMPLLLKIRPRRFGATARVALHPGQTPQRFVDAAEAMAHSWGVHAVRAVPTVRGRIELTILRKDPLSDASVGDVEVAPRMTEMRAPVPDDLRVVGGNREDGQPWVLDLIAFPHWLITGATQSGKSTLLNTAVAQWAQRPIALVGIDCKGGMALGRIAPRLSALACDRFEAADVLELQVAEAQRRMALCRRAGVENIWELPDEIRPVPIIVIVDEVAELYLVASRSEKEVAQRAATHLVRLAQLGAALGMHVIAAGQRVGTDLGPGVTLLRSQLGGRICLKVHDPETADMTLGDLYPDAVEAAQQIGPMDKGVAITTADAFGWTRARSIKTSNQTLAQIIENTRDLKPRLPDLDIPPSE